jgi:squalene monooxygenase
MRVAFEHAAKTQVAKVMPNRAMSANPALLRGATLLGDALNTRHPLTGSGMSVCLRDVELLTRVLQGVELSDGKV